MKNLGERQSVEEIRQRIAALRADDARLWGLMSVVEMLCHVRQAYRGAGTQAEVKIMPGPLPPKVLKFFALRVPMQWPKTIQTVPGLRREALPPRRDFEVERALLIEAFNAFVEEAAERFGHPIFGSMTTRDWQRWGYLHADHHLRQFGR